mgnify:CR=1 FL=1
MTQLLDELERAVTDLLQSGLDTGGPAACARLRTLAVRCEDAGLHTGELVVEHYLKQRNVGFYADRLCLTPKYLSKVIKRLSGHTVPEWISRILVLHAQVLLKSSKQTVQQIALELNFPNASFFGRFFKKHTGMTPGQYRLKS